MHSATPSRVARSPLTGAVVLVAVVIGVLLPTIATAPPAGAATGEIFTIAGSTGSGATAIGVDAQRVVWTSGGLSSATSVPSASGVSTSPPARSR
ncbi:MAG: hypothetical protein R2690_00695 [Acidimicrobiales bacterium]